MDGWWRDTKLIDRSMHSQKRKEGRRKGEKEKSSSTGNECTSCNNNNGSRMPEIDFHVVNFEKRNPAWPLFVSPTSLFPFNFLSWNSYLLVKPFAYPISTYVPVRTYVRVWVKRADLHAQQLIRSHLISLFLNSHIILSVCEVISYLIINESNRKVQFCQTALD